MAEVIEKRHDLIFKRFEVEAKTIFNPVIKEAFVNRCLSSIPVVSE
jgi:hypothetical protein